MKIKTEIINEIDRLELLFDRLNSPSQKEIIPSLCTSKPWIINWLNHYLNDADKLFVCVQQTDDLLIAIYPLYLKKIGFGYELRFIGSGEPEHVEVCSEFQDFIIAPEFINESLALFTEQVKQLKKCYRISFDKILPDSLCYKWLKHYQKLGWHYREQYIGKRFILSIADDEHTQIFQLAQATLKRQARRFIERTDITVEQCTAEQELPNFFEDLISLHTLNWQKKGKLGAFSSEQFREFHHEFASMMLAQQKLLMFRLVYKDAAIAVFYGLYHQGILYYYQSGISRNSTLPNAGIAIHLTAMRYARARGYHYYDLMTGQDSSYKQQYVKADTPVYSVRLTVFWLKTLNLKTRLKLLIKLFFNRK